MIPTFLVQILEDVKAIFVADRFGDFNYYHYSREYFLELL